MNVFKKAWNIFNNKDPSETYNYQYGSVYGSNPDKPRLTYGKSKSIIATVYNRIAVDCAAVDIKHVVVNNTGQYEKDKESTLNQLFAVQANIDQTGRQLIRDAVLSMLDEGVVAIVPVDTDTNIEDNSFSVLSARVSKIVAWSPTSVQVYIYNDKTGQHEYCWVPKHSCIILENPFYTVMNETDSTAQRLISKLNLLDISDNSKSTTKLDLIIGLPYVVKNPLKKAQAEERRKEIIDQLTNSEYGIAYTDGSEKITQLNRAVESNLMPQIEYYTRMLYNQLGITEALLNNTASPEEVNNYMTNLIEPILTTIVEEIKRKWLTKTARSQKQSIMYFRNPFKLIPIDKLPDIADKFTRNEILSTNDIRGFMGIIPSKQKGADELRNKNLSPAKTQGIIDVNENIKEENQNEDET